MLRHAALAFICAAIVWGGGPVTAQPLTRDPSKVPAGAYVLNGRQSSLTIRIPLMGGVAHYGMRFIKLSGNFDFDPASLQSTKVEITVDPRAIAAENNNFHRAVVSYFEPDEYPVILFRSTALVADATGRGKLKGDLTFHGVTRPITLNVQFNGFEPGIQGAGIGMAFSGTGMIKRSQFGVIAGRLLANDKIDLNFEVEFTRR